ncbi:YcjX family protein [Escherichia coli]
MERFAATPLQGHLHAVLEIVDYPGEWLFDLPMLAQDYLSWSRQMTGLLNGQRGEWSVNGE